MAARVDRRRQMIFPHVREQNESGAQIFARKLMSDADLRHTFELRKRMTIIMPAYVGSLDSCLL
jgi:hypothetical protein